MRAFSGVGLLVCLVAAQASAQTAPAAPSAIFAHYQAYSADIERGDYAAAEPEAVAALAASELRDGDGGRTAILALNLATTRLALDRAPDAIAPAERAWRLAQSRGARSGVDPLMARLIAGRAEVSGGQGDEGERLLIPALQEAAANADLVTERYYAATTLATWAFNDKRYQIARDAWAAAEQAAEGAHNANFARGVALVRQVGSMILTDITRTSGEHLLRTTSRDAFIKLNTAYQLLGPLADHDPTGPEADASERGFAELQAWWGTLAVLAASQDYPNQWMPMAPDRPPGHIAPEQTASGECPVHLSTDPRPRYPPQDQQLLHVGVVVMFLQFGGDGQITHHSVAAVVGGPAFEHEVASVADQWTQRLDRRAFAGCHVPKYRFVPVTFRFAE